MQSKDIIIKLIDNQLITGEEAYTLLNDILKAEMVAVNESLKELNKPPTINIPGVQTTDPIYHYATTCTNNNCTSTSSATGI